MAGPKPKRPYIDRRKKEHESTYQTGYDNMIKDDDLITKDAYKNKKERDFIKSFQTEYNKDKANKRIAVDGILGPETMGAYTKYKDSRKVVPKQNPVTANDGNVNTGPTAVVEATRTNTNVPEVVKDPNGGFKPAQANDPLTQSINQYPVYKLTDFKQDAPKAEPTIVEPKRLVTQDLGVDKPKTEPTVYNPDLVGKPLPTLVLEKPTSDSPTTPVATQGTHNSILDTQRNTPGITYGNRRSSVVFNPFQRKSKNVNQTSTNENGFNTEQASGQQTGSNQSGKRLIDYNKDANTLDINLPKLPKVTMYKSDGTPVRVLGGLRDKLAANREKKDNMKAGVNQLLDGQESDYVPETGRDAAKFRRIQDRTMRQNNREVRRGIADEGKLDMNLNMMDSRRETYEANRPAVTEKALTIRDAKYQMNDNKEQVKAAYDQAAARAGLGETEKRMQKKIDRSNKRTQKMLSYTTDAYKGGGLIKAQKGFTLPKYQYSGYLPAQPENLIISNAGNDNGGSSFYNDSAKRVPQTVELNTQMPDGRTYPTYSDYIGGKFTGTKTTPTLNNQSNQSNQSGQGFEYDPTRLLYYGNKMQADANMLPVLFNTSKALLDKAEVQKPFYNQQDNAYLGAIRNNQINADMNPVYANQAQTNQAIRNNVRGSGQMLAGLLASQANTNDAANKIAYQTKVGNQAQQNMYAQALNQVGANRQQQNQLTDNANRQHRATFENYTKDALESGEKALINRGQLHNAELKNQIEINGMLNNIASDYKFTQDRFGQPTVQFISKGDNKLKTMPLGMITPDLVKSMQSAHGAKPETTTNHGQNHQVNEDGTTSKKLFGGKIGRIKLRKYL